jgi:diadenosine tetraphosphatase ApaH/serine/threonine PP2A family protein phosphatase
MSWPSPADRFQNPFSASRVRPGAAPFLFPPGENAAAMVARLAQFGWRGSIVGPHGSGKSTLLAALRAEIEGSGRRTLLIALHDGERHLPLDLRKQAELAPGAIVIVDGYEQLSWWSRWKLRRLCNRRNWGLLVTAHTPVGLPLVACTSTSPELAQRIVDQLLPVDSLNALACESPIKHSDVAERFALHQGNLREVLFDLYDLYESRRPSGSADTAE